MPDNTSGSQAPRAGDDPGRGRGGAGGHRLAVTSSGFVLTTDPAEFYGLAWPFLQARIGCNVLATVLLGILDGRFRGVTPLFACSLGPDGALSGAALRTPPLPLLTSELDPAGAEALIDVWLRHDPECNGVNGPPATSRAVAAAWRARTGGHTRLARNMAVHAAEEVVDPPRPPAGSLRLGRPAERELLIDWWRAFAHEADSPGGVRARASVDARLDDDGLFVWDDGGPVSFLAITPAVAGVVRVGPVYTPPEHRRRGYAGMAVAEVSRRALAGGASACMLFTDLANPTSNKIYGEVGYRRIGDWEEHAFTA